MDFITRILPRGAVSTGLVTLSFAVVIGLALGAIRVRGISLGLAAVLFAGLAMGAAGFHINDEALVFTRSFSLIIFVYAVGLQVGPGFLGAFKSEGLMMNALSAVVVILGAALTIAIVLGAKLPHTLAPGLYTGALSSTPAFAAGQEALLDRLHKHSSESSARDVLDAIRASGVAFAVTYPLGVVGPILVIILMRWMFRVNVDAERAALEKPHAHASSTKHHAHAHHGNLARARLLVTRTAALGKTLAQLDLEGRFHLTVTHVHRTGVEIPARPGLKLQFADHLHVIGPREGIEAAEKVLGNSTAALRRPQLFPVFVGIVLGVIAGSVPISLPGLHSGIKLGLAGGPLLVAILLSQLGHVGSVVWYMPAPASNLLRDFGMALFLACAGLQSGGEVASVLRSGEGLIYLGWGALITMTPMLVVAIFARVVMKMNFVTLAGLIGGAMTSTPTMLFATDFTRSQRPAEIYAAVYPLGMLIPVFAAQALVAMLV